jgi:hypothetical protein
MSFSKVFRRLRRTTIVRVVVVLVCTGVLCQVGGTGSVPKRPTAGDPSKVPT